MKCKIFLTSMGWGHATRVLILLKELLKVIPDLKITIQANKKLKIFEKILNKKINFIQDENLIKFYFKNNGELDLPKTSKKYKNFLNKSEAWILKNLKDKNYDFFISDISPEGIQVGYLLGKPIFGIGHFTWDWFASKLKKKIINKKILSKWSYYQKNATKIFFPPLTPKILYKKYSNHVKVPFIYLNNTKNINFSINQKKILFIDSGDNIYKYYFKSLIHKYKNNKNIKIFHSEKVGNYKTSYVIKKKYTLTDFIKNVDYIIARPGYNTMTSIIKSNKPATFICDKKNPEMKWNSSVLYKMKRFRICDIKDLDQEFKFVVKNTIENKYQKKIISDKINKSFNGQKVISKYIKGILDEQ